MKKKKIIFSSFLVFREEFAGKSCFRQITRLGFEPCTISSRHVFLLDKKSNNSVINIKINPGINEDEGRNCIIGVQRLLETNWLRIKLKITFLMFQAFYIQLALDIFLCFLITIVTFVNALLIHLLHCKFYTFSQNNVQF